MSNPEELDVNAFDDKAKYDGADLPTPEQQAQAVQEAADAGAQADPTSPLEDMPPTQEERILTLEEEVVELKNKLLRSLADKENMRKRAEKEKADTRVYAIEKFAADLIAVGDNLERSKLSLTPEMREGMGEAGKALSEGVEMTMRALQDTLARHGVKAIEAAPGTLFDPNIHQAVSQIPSAEAAGAIAMTFQPGWQIGERTLRAAMVAVSAGQPQQPPATPESPEQTEP